MYVLARSGEDGTVLFSGFVLNRKVGDATLEVRRTDACLVADLKGVEVYPEERGKGYDQQLRERIQDYLEAQALAFDEPIELRCA